MNKKDIENRINGLNEYMLSDSDKKLLMLSISSDYTYNKAIALVKKKNIQTKTGIQLITRIVLKLGMKLKPL